MTTSNPLVSIGIPTYNRPNQLRRALESACNQRYKNIEIIVSDNCSPGSETNEIVSEFLSKDDRIRFFRQKKNEGMMFNFYFVLEMAKGHYFFWLSDDDYISPDFISILLQYLEMDKSIMVAMCATQRIDQNGVKLDIIRNFNTHLDLNHSNNIQLAFNVVNNDFMSYWIYGIFRTQFIKEIVINIIHGFAEDILIVTNVMLAGKIYYIDEILQYREMHNLQTDELYRNEQVGKYYGEKLKFYKKFYYLHIYLWRSSLISFQRKLLIPVIVLKGLCWQLVFDIRKIFIIIILLISRIMIITRNKFKVQ